MALFLRISSCLLLFWAVAAQADEKPNAPGTQLVFAATSGSVADVQAALKQGADPNSANEAGTPALALAAERKDDAATPVVTALLDARADPNREDAAGQTALFYAAHKGKADVAVLLLQRGADFYHGDRQGKTARDAAYKANQMQTLKAMDGFMQDKTNSVLKQYEAHNQQLAERDKAIAENAAAIAERDKQLAQSQATKPKVVQKSMPTQPKAPVDTKRLLLLTHDLSYHACAAEYWRFLLAAHMEAIGHDAMRSELESERAQTLAAGDAIKKEFGAHEGYVDKISGPSARQITDQLAAPVTNAGRKSEGMGSKDDLHDRCADIADQWELGKPPAAQAHPARAGGGSLSDK